MPPDPCEVYRDNLFVPGHEILVRVLHPRMVKWGDGGTAERIGKNAFQDYPADRLHEVGAPAVAVSVYLTSCLVANGRTWDDVRLQWGDEYGVAHITAEAARAAGQGIIRWSTDAEVSHAMVFTRSGSKKSRSQQSALANAAELIHAPAPPVT